MFIAEFGVQEEKKYYVLKDENGEKFCPFDPQPQTWCCSSCALFLLNLSPDKERASVRLGCTNNIEFKGLEVQRDGEEERKLA